MVRFLGFFLNTFYYRSSQNQSSTALSTAHMHGPGPEGHTFLMAEAHKRWKEGRMLYSEVRYKKGKGQIQQRTEVLEG